MKSSSNHKRIGLAVILLAVLAACNKPGPAETAGKKIDQATNEAGKSIAEATEKTVTSIDDAEITAKVKASIFAEPGLKTLQIGVDTVKSVVTLSGSADSQSSSDRAKALAASVAGVKDVENKLAIKSTN